MIRSFPGATSAESAEFEISSIESCGKLPLGFGGHSATLVGDCVFIFGGHYLASDGLYHYSHDLYVLNLPRMKWSIEHNYRGARPMGRYNHSAALVEKEVFIFGGRAEGGKILKDMHVLEISSQLQTLVDPH